jgi:hypothetical protein
MSINIDLYYQSLFHDDRGIIVDKLVDKVAKGCGA